MTEEKLDSQSLISSLRSHFEITVVVAAHSESGRAGVAELEEGITPASLSYLTHLAIYIRAHLPAN